MSSCLSLSVCDRHKLNSSLSLRPRRAPSSSSPTTETGLIFQPAPCWRTKSYLATSASWTTSALFFQYTHIHTHTHSLIMWPSWLYPSHVTCLSCLPDTNRLWREVAWRLCVIACAVLLCSPWLGFTALYRPFMVWYKHLIVLIRSSLYDL